MMNKEKLKTSIIFLFLLVGGVLFAVQAEIETCDQCSFYAEAYYHNHTATTLNFAVQNVYYNLTLDIAPFIKGFTFDDAGDRLIVNNAGLYKVCMMASGTGQNNHVYYLSFMINGVDSQNFEAHKKMSAGGDVVTMTGCGLERLNVGDELKIAVKDTTGTGTGDYYSSNLNLVKVGS